MLKKSTLREIKNSLARYLAIFAIVALGVGFFAGLQMCQPDMLDTANEYLQQQNLYDYEIITNYGIDEESVKLAEETKCVAAAEGSIQQDIVIDSADDSQSVLKAISLPAEINKIRIIKGRLPKTNKECVVDNVYANRYKIGDTIQLSQGNKQEDLNKFAVKEFKVVGYVNTPLYLDFERGTTTIGNGTLDAYFYVQPNAFDVDVYTQLYIKLKVNDAAFSKNYDDKIAKYEKSMKSLASRISEARIKKVRSEAEKQIKDGLNEYEKGLSEYNSNLISTRNQIYNSRKQALDAQRELNANESRLRNTLAELQNNRTQVVAGINQCNATIAEAERQYAAGEIDYAQYEQIVANAQATLSELNTNLAAIDAGLQEANNGIAQINIAKRDLRKALNDIDAGEITANKELASGKTELDKARAELDDAQSELDSIESNEYYINTRDDNSGYSTFDSNAEIVSNIAKIFPIFFFLIAALVVMTTMTRMVDDQRSQIGVLKALGYSNTAVLGKYLFYSGSAAFTGSVFGLVVGCKVFPSVIWYAYTMMYDFDHTVNILVNWKLCAVCILVALLCSMGATWISCSGDFNVMPAQLIRPKTPRAGKRILLERITPIWSKLGFLRKVSFRNVFRYKKRFFMMVLGISGCTALLVAGFGINSSVRNVANYQYSEIVQYDYQVVFDKNMTDADQNTFRQSVKKDFGNIGDMLFVNQEIVNLEHDSESSEALLISTDNTKITDFVKFHLNGEEVKYPGDGEVIVCYKYKKHYGIDIGDTIKLRNGSRVMTARVSGVYDNYVKESIYMTDATYEKGFGKKPETKTAYVMAPNSSSSEKLRRTATSIGQYDGVVATVINQDMIDRVDDMMKSLNAIIYVVIICAGLLAFIVLYNLTNINITERIREIATIKVLGFRHREVSQYVFRENIILTAIAAVVGLPLGKFLLDFIIDSIKVNMILFTNRTTWLDYLIAFVLTFVFAFIVNLAMRRKLRNVSMTESLKEIE